MSNSVVFLLIAIGLSVLGTLAVWLQGRPRRPRSSVDVFHRSLQALATNDTRLEPLSGVTVRQIDDDPTYDDPAYGDPTYGDPTYGDTAYDEVAGDDPGYGSQPTRSPRPSPRPRPRPPAPRSSRAGRQEADPGA